jgi:hypothetical protein
MKTATRHHLDENALLRALVDPEELNPDQREHLAACGQCREEIAVLSGDLEKMVRVAENLSPRPERPIRVPSEKAPRRFGRLPFGRRMAAGMAAAMVCLIAGGLYWQHVLDRRHAQAMIDARQLMVEINALVENPLPPVVMGLSAEVGAGNDEDFFRFLIPEESGKPVLSRIGEKGLRT